MTQEQITKLLPYLPICEHDGELYYTPTEPDGENGWVVCYYVWTGETWEKIDEEEEEIPEEVLDASNPYR